MTKVWVGVCWFAVGFAVRHLCQLMRDQRPWDSDQVILSLVFMVVAGASSVLDQEKIDNNKEKDKNRIVDLEISK